MKLFTLISLLCLSSFVAKADYMEESTIMFGFSEDPRANTLDAKFYTRDFCFRQCGIVMYSYKECKNFAATIEEKNICITDDEKICLMNCKNQELEKNGLIKELQDNSFN